MAAAKHDFILHQGDSFSRTITWKDPAGNPINLTGYTAKLQIRATIDAATPIMELNTAPGVGQGSITLGGSAGTIVLTLTKELSAGMNFAGAPQGVVQEGVGTNRVSASGLCAVYDLELTSASGVRTTILRGLFCLESEVTR